MNAFNVTTELVDLNPENYVYWNIRREILVEGIFPSLSKEIEKEFNNGPPSNTNIEQLVLERKQEILKNDVNFVLSKLKQYPKTYWLWNHRVWCLDEMPFANWDQELQLVDYLLSKDARNFHGWHYRRIVIDKISKQQQKNPNPKKEQQQQQSLTKQEFEYTTSKINSNFSNFSAWYNRALLIPDYLKELENEKEKDDENVRFTFLIKEIDYIRQALYTDPDISSSWFYHKWFYSNITNTICPDISKEKFIEILKEEIELVDELRQVEPNNSYCLLALVHLRDTFRRVNNGDDDDEEEIKKVLNVYETLEKIDSLRKNMYIDWKEKYQKSLLLIK